MTVLAVFDAFRGSGKHLPLLLLVLQNTVPIGILLMGGTLLGGNSF